MDKEYLVVQSEFYLGPQGGAGDATKVATQKPDLVVFNGYANQYRDRPIPAKVGEKVRVWVLDAGPNVGSAFHVVGGQFDTVFKEGEYLLKDGGSTGIGRRAGARSVAGAGRIRRVDLPGGGELLSAQSHHVRRREGRERSVPGSTVVPHRWETGYLPTRRDAQRPVLRALEQVVDLEGIRIPLLQLGEQRQRVVAGDQVDGCAEPDGVQGAEDRGVTDGVGDEAGVQDDPLAVLLTAGAGGAVGVCGGGGRFAVQSVRLQRGFDAELRAGEQS